MEKLRFKLTAEHVKLLRKAYISYSHVEWGAPTIDPKRPYGSSDVLESMAEILNLDVFTDAYGESHLSKEQTERLKALHHETEKALQVVLSAGSFEPGVYEASFYDPSDWRRVSAPQS